MDELIYVTNTSDIAADIVLEMKRIVPEYKSNNSTYEYLDAMIEKEELQEV